MAFWANALGYQAAWLAAVCSAARGQAWLGMLACVGFIAWQWRASRQRAADTRVLLAALACGLIVDGACAASGLLRYASPAPALPAPPWIVLLWGAFALTLNHSLAWFARRPWSATAFAGVGGPLAYLGAARGFGAVDFPDPAWPALAVLAAAWACALPVLLRIAVTPWPGAATHSTRS
ncbi:DUF2878 domain-containing protein [Lysobacter silvisoli]|uniref:DUF2878 domain-containing protein n=1 Tax=Lysobacter silvisoli TaxID=2293254 RepID=A0A371K2C2_9GAMM|nr:DUF2878 domain-containing protein [Lysobacter silvisoli]RDZ28065.1 DUF2878 domain-containing protein [Lysobacter silvisoli]